MATRVVTAVSEKLAVSSLPRTTTTTTSSNSNASAKFPSSKAPPLRFFTVHTTHGGGAATTASCPSPSSSWSPTMGILGGSAAAVVSTAIAMALLASTASAASSPQATPYSIAQTQKMQLGLLDGKIRPCPSNINPNCISTSSMTAKFAIPWVIPVEASQSAARKLLDAIQATQNHPKVLTFEDTPSGKFLQVEVDGLFGRDIMEFLVKDDVVTYRSLAQKVLYVYPFTTPITDFSTQEKRLKALEIELGWTGLDWDSYF